MAKSKRRKTQQPRVLDELQQRILLEALKSRERDRMLVLFCLRTGLRNAEACGMNIGDVLKFGNIVTTLEVRAEIAKIRSQEEYHSSMTSETRFTSSCSGKQNKAKKMNWTARSFARFAQKTVLPPATSSESWKQHQQC